jgi:thiol-disulfide isomerase/thioredoxin
MQKSSLRWLAIGVVAAVGLGAGIYFARQAQAPQAPDSGGTLAQDPAVAAALAGLALPDPDGKEQKLAQWRGKVVVVNFWATWCAPCRDEMPEFMKAQAELGSKGLQFVGIAVDQPDKVREYVKETKLNYPTLVGGFGAMELSKSLGNSLMALPFTVVLDRKGNVVLTQLGVLKPEKLATITSQLL